MFRNLAAKKSENGLIEYGNGMVEVGQVANHVAARSVFNDYRERKADNTLRRQDVDLALFARYLQERGVDVDSLAEDPKAWAGVTWGLVAGFVRWQLHQGYAVTSVNVRLSTVKTYSKLASKAGEMDPTEYALIRAVEGYSRKERGKVDEKRLAAGANTRIGSKKAEAVSLTVDQVNKLKDQPDTPQGRRDRLMICLMADHSMRVGEVAILKVDNFDLERGEVFFYCPKVDLWSTHKLEGDTWRSAKDYIQEDQPDPEGAILMGSTKAGNLIGGMSTRAITARVRYLGKKLLGIEGLSAHDLRHYWATRAAEQGTRLERLMDGGGWVSSATAMGYIERAQYANEGVQL